MDQDKSATSSTTTAPASVTSPQNTFANTSNILADMAKTEVKNADTRKTVRSLYMTPAVRTYAYYMPPPGWIMRFTWPTLHAGDCRMEGAQLHLYPDAMAFFQASTFSSSSGDVWLILGIQFFDAFHNPVGHPIPQHNGMNMAWEGSEYPIVFWDAIPGVTPAGAAQISNASMTYHC